MDGELLCPARWSDATVREIEREMGPQVAAAQLQQRPAPLGGNVFQREWFRLRWMRPENPKWARLSIGERENYLPLPTHWIMQILSADCAFKDRAGSDHVALHTWGMAGGKYYLLDRITDVMGLPETVRCWRVLAARWPRATGKLIEDKANGPAVEQLVRGEMSGIIMVNPEGGKVARANAVSPLAAAGDVVLPDESELPGIGAMLEEVLSFPFARHDDDVDSMTQALRYLHDHSRTQGRYLQAMARVATGDFAS